MHLLCSDVQVAANAPKCRGTHWCFPLGSFGCLRYDCPEGLFSAAHYCGTKQPEGRTVWFVTSTFSDCWTLKVEALLSFETSVTTRRHVQEDVRLQQHRCDNVKSALSNSRTALWHLSDCCPCP